MGGPELPLVEGHRGPLRPKVRGGHAGNKARGKARRKRIGYCASPPRDGSLGRGGAPSSAHNHPIMAEYDAIVEYAAALEAEKLELKSVGGGKLTISNIPNISASATITNASTVLM